MARTTTQTKLADVRLAGPATGTVSADPTPSASTARAFVRAVVEQNRAALDALLTEDVWLRCLLVRTFVEQHERESAATTIHGWFGNAAEVVVEDTFHRTIEGREHVGWRVRVRPEWNPAVWHLIEQVGYVRVADGRIGRIDLVCTGFHPLTPHA
jgi:hypothetical protein